MVLYLFIYCPCAHTCEFSTVNMFKVVHASTIIKNCTMKNNSRKAVSRVLALMVKSRAITPHVRVSKWLLYCLFVFYFGEGDSFILLLYLYIIYQCLVCIVR